MNRTRWGLLLAVVAAVGYSGVRLMISVQVDRYMEDVRTQLVAHEQFQVNSMRYENGFFDGRLHYDLVFRPPADSALRDVLLDITDDSVLPLQGIMEVDHGPLLRGGGFGLAKGRLEVALPASLRPGLPQYPGQQPAVTVDAMFSFTGETVIDVQVTDYDGILGTPDTPAAGELILSGAAAKLRLSRDLMAVSGTFHTDNLALGERMVEPLLGLRGLDSRFDLRRVSPGVWTGPVRVSVDGLDIGSGLLATRFQELAVSTSSRVEDGLLGGRLAADAVQVSIAGTRLRDLHLRASAAQIDARAYAEMLALTESGALLDSRAAMERLPGMIEQLLESGPRLQVSEFSATLAEPKDVLANAELAWTGSGQVDLNDPAGLLQYVRFGLDLSLSEEGVAHQVRQRVARANPNATQQERETRAGVLLRQTRELMLLAGMRSDGAGHLVWRVALTDGQVAVNGRVVDPSWLISPIL